ncbi:hypothetical protein LX77_01371 [Gelidibacter algens]|uniref:Surface antigen-like protein n=1 Tax=Gelidibacter algens TaxID=49280 RepID=A0A1A7R3K9_9FLAO|nr:hypothetical protein [Gelidibacter algens]OBX26431.1 hypothetical protein A9996_05205 [Gelidibacter algens]RAJ25952.1 hypothetical protein LX77_01371 [Gelidibacter algens]
MQKYGAYLFFFVCIWSAQSQIPTQVGDTLTVIEQDSLKRSKFFKQIGNGFFPTKYIDIDLRYLFKFNQYEGVRTGLGGRTNNNLSERYRMDGYVVYGFKDHNFKYSIGGGFRLSKDSETWVNLSYTDDLQETGSSNFLTDKRFFSFFEPRLLNINLFHHHITKAISLEHRITPYLLSETQISRSNVTTTYNYEFFVDDTAFKEFRMTMAKVSLQWNPFNTFETVGDLEVEKEGFPNFTLQLSQSFKDVLDGDFNFFKADFRTIYKLNYDDAGHSFTEATLTSGIATGKTPLTHLYHAYPNNINKETILQRFSVAGINSFETMYFNEFFSDRFATFQLKHYLKPFNIGKRFQPQMVLISRFAIGNMHDIERHQEVDFETLNKGYSEAGFEINKILFGFGLSFAYRYGAYHLPEFADNVAAKFTFNITL